MRSGGAGPRCRRAPGPCRCHRREPSAAGRRLLASGNGHVRSRPGGSARWGRADEPARPGFEAPVRRSRRAPRAGVANARAPTAALASAADECGVSLRAPLIFEGVCERADGRTKKFRAHVDNRCYNKLPLRRHPRVDRFHLRHCNYSAQIPPRRPRAPTCASRRWPASPPAASRPAPGRPPWQTCCERALCLGRAPASKEKGQAARTAAVSDSIFRPIRGERWVHAGNRCAAMADSGANVNTSKCLVPSKQHRSKPCSLCHCAAIGKGALYQASDSVLLESQRSGSFLFSPVGRSFGPTGVKGKICYLMPEQLFDACL